MEYYINLPTEENMPEFKRRCAQFEATLIICAIKQLNISETSKRLVLNDVLKMLANQ